MRSRPASQLADDGEAAEAYDPSSAEPLLHQDGVRKSVGPAPDGSDPNASYFLIKHTVDTPSGSITASILMMFR